MLKMEKSEVLIKLTMIFKKSFNNSSIVLFDEMTANDLEGWDSLTHMLLVSEIEERFNIKFKLKDLNKMRNVGDMVEIIISKINE